jgi:hypothetical protein
MTQGETGKPLAGRAVGAKRRFACQVFMTDAIARFEFAIGCTMSAAVTKSLLDRIFSSRFESWRSKKSLFEDFHQDNFFVLVCGPFLLIENFLAPSKQDPQRGACYAGKMSAFILQSFISGR